MSLQARTLKNLQVYIAIAIPMCMRRIENELDNACMQQCDQLIDFIYQSKQFRFINKFVSIDSFCRLFFVFKMIDQIPDKSWRPPFVDIETK